MSNSIVSEVYDNCNISVYDAIVFFLNTYFNILFLHYTYYIILKYTALLVQDSTTVKFQLPTDFTQLLKKTCRTGILEDQGWEPLHHMTTFH